IGIQRELRRGLVLSADYVRNVETRALLGVDVNHVGDTRYFNATGANAAIAQTISDCNAGSLDDAIAPGGCLPLEPANIGVQMSDFAARGLATTSEVGVETCPHDGAGVNLGCAFPGLNKDVANINFLLPIGRSVYNAFDLKLVQNVLNPVRGVKSANFQIA